jgi:hypothetical protein
MYVIYVPTSKELNLKTHFQIVLLGDADEIVQHLCEQLQWDLRPSPNPKNGLEVPRSQTNGKRTSGEMIGRAEPMRIHRR